MSRFCVLALIALTFAAAPAMALTVSGDLTYIDAPESVAKGVLESDTTSYLFMERGLVPLGFPLLAQAGDPGMYDSRSDLGLTLTPGPLLIDSFYLHTDRVTERGDGRLDMEGSVTFDGHILAVILDKLPLLTTDPILGAPGTTYSNLWQSTARGYELGRNNDWFHISDDGYTLTFHSHIGPYTDDLRIITEASPNHIPPAFQRAVPEPATAGLAALALAGGALAATRRRRSA